MTTTETITIYLAEPRQTNKGRYEVFGNYEGPDDRYTFGVKTFPNSPAGFHAAEAYAIRLRDSQQGAMIELD
jgi:hypothetical protein